MQKTLEIEPFLCHPTGT